LVNYEEIGFWYKFFSGISIMFIILQVIFTLSAFSSMFHYKHIILNGTTDSRIPSNFGAWSIVKSLEKIVEKVYYGLLLCAYRLKLLTEKIKEKFSDNK
jgi:hypothetical protein